MGLLSTIGSASGRAFGFTRSAIAAATDAFFNRVTLLLPGNGTNGAQNNTFLDSSSNTFSITRNGNTTQGTFSPFSQTGWSNYLSGSSDHFTTPSSAFFDLNTSTDWTIEGWFFPTSFSSSNNVLLYIGSSASNKVVIATAGTSGTLYYLLNGASAIAGTSSPTLNAWNHVALVKSGTTTTLWLNGASLGTTTSVPTAGNKAVVIGTDAGAALYAGYMSNVRVAKGVAVYTSAFTPPTAPLGITSGGQTPPTGSQTVLLACQSNRFIDVTGNSVISVGGGTPSVQAFSPFAPTAAYSAATNGGSGYFDGTGDYLSISNGITDAGTNDLCVEFFAYYTGGTFGDYKFAFDSRTSGGSFKDGVGIAANTSTGAWYVSWAGQEILGTAKAGAYWNHICLTRQSGVFRLFVDGVLQGTHTPSTAYNFTSTANRIGWYYSTTASYQWPGYISNFRTTKSAVPTSYQTSSTTVGAVIFTPPSAPLTTTSQGASGTAFLANFTNAGITDATAKNDLETVGNAQISTTQSKFGGSSISFDGTGDYLDTLNGQNFVFGTGDFTIEFWLYTSATAFGLLQLTGGTTGYWQLNVSSSTMYWQSSRTVTNLVSTTATSVINGAWHHIAVVRSSGTTRIYFDGVSQASAADTTNYNGSGGVLRIGYDTNSASLNGYIDDLRITKGLARYTGNFTAPTAAFALQ